MDRALQELERAWREGRDPGAALELARARLRAGRLPAALTLAAAGGDTTLRAQVGESLAAAHELEYLGPVGGFDRFTRQGEVVVLVPGGLFLEEVGEQAETSLLRPGGGQRTPLRPCVLPDLLVGIEAHPEADPESARRAAKALGGRLPSPGEWKKAWRGGIHLDGDEVGLRELALPDQVGPWGYGEPPQDDLAVSPYGIEFRLGWWEHCLERGAGLGYLSGRYRVSLETPADRRGRRLAWRAVLELQRLR